MLKNNIKVILLAFITSIAFSINFCTVTDEAAQEGFQKIYSFIPSINRLILSFDTVSLASILMLILLFIFYKKADIGINSVRTRILSTVLSIMLSLSIVIGGCFYQYGAIDLLNKGIVQSLKTFIAVFGYALFFYYMINFVSVKYGSRQIIYNNFKISIFEKSHSLMIIAVILLLAWLPSIWAYYPAMFMGDSEDIIYMSYNYPTGLINTVDLVNEDVYITNHHSAAYTLFIGAVLKMIRYGGGTDNQGIFLCAMIQCIISALVLSYSCIYCARQLKNTPMAIAAMLFYSLCPWIPKYAIMITKDTLFADFILLFGIIIHKECIISKGHFTINKICIITGLAVSIFLMRKNGIFVIIFTLV